MQETRKMKSFTLFFTDDFFEKVNIHGVFTFTSEILNLKIEIINPETISPKLKDINCLLDQETAFVIFQKPDISKRKKIQRLLKKCRNLRIPYIFWDINTLYIENIRLLVTYLSEDKELAPWGATFGKTTKGNIKIFVPNDFGSRAKINAEFIADFIEKKGQSKILVNSKFRSSNIKRKESSNSLKNELTFFSASRSYSLDDDIFGPQELNAIQNSSGTVGLINPRSDLYILCE